MSEALGVRAAAVWLGRRGTFAALLLLLLVNAAITPHFLAWQTLAVNATQVATIIIVATGMTLVIATGGIDLSVGSLMAIAGTLSPMIFGGRFGALPAGLADALAILVPILVAGSFGWINGLFVTVLRIQPIVATLILFIAGRGIAQVATNGNLQPFTRPAVQWIGLGRLAGIPVQVLLAAVAVALAAGAVRRTVWGRQVLAIGGNEHAAMLAGVPIGRIKRSVYVASGLCAGIAGLVTVAINSSSDANTVGLGMELDAIAAVAVGGTPLAGGSAHLVGTLLGAMVIQLVRYMLLANGVPDAAALVVKAGLIIAAVALRR
ncbi:MAG: ABC transporter permease [Acetobacteraceae bacterium]|nr:ABC transporter permease [Acetobacteraceae bacterium]